MCPEPYPDENLEFLRSQNIQLLHFGIEGKTVIFFSHSVLFFAKIFHFTSSCEIHMFYLLAISICLIACMCTSVLVNV